MRPSGFPNSGVLTLGLALGVVRDFRREFAEHELTPELSTRALLR